MRQNEVFPYYKKCCEGLDKAYKYIESKFDIDESVNELCTLRGYTKDGEQADLLRKLKICSCVVDNKLYLGEMADELGLATKTERFLLDDRFIIPVRNLDGRLVTLIGYYPDNKKYITCPAPFFSKDVLFFNADDAIRKSFEKYDGLVFLVEGIFDCLSLRAIGLPAMATMGSTVSREKREILKIFKKVLYIPDNDAVGRRALNRHDKSFGWAVPENATGIKLSGVVDFRTKEEEESSTEEESEVSKKSMIKIKDIDNLIAWFDADSVREMLLEYRDSRSEVESMDIGYIKYFE